jgi:hypothetical protein
LLQPQANSFLVLLDNSIKLESLCHSLDFI